MHCYAICSIISTQRALEHRFICCVFAIDSRKIITLRLSRGPISIFEQIFELKDRSEDGLLAALTRFGGDNSTKKKSVLRISGRTGGR